MRNWLQISTDQRVCLEELRAYRKLDDCIVVLTYTNGQEIILENIDAQHIMFTIDKLFYARED